MVKTSYRLAVVLLAALGVGGVSFFGYRMMRADLAAAVYRDRLERVATDYKTLAATYNDAIRRTAVTELLVEKGRLNVVVRNDEGVLKTIETPIDPSREVYVDFVVVDGRLWIRRVFDAATAPEKGTLIDPAVADVNWNDPKVAHGQAVYRSLTEGRWVVSVSGDGALGLAKAPSDAPAALANRPEIKKHDEVTGAADAQVKAISFGDVWRLLTGD